LKLKLLILKVQRSTRTQIGYETNLVTKNSIEKFIDIENSSTFTCMSAYPVSLTPSSALLSSSFFTVHNDPVIIFYFLQLHLAENIVFCKGYFIFITLKNIIEFLPEKEIFFQCARFVLIVLQLLLK